MPRPARSTSARTAHHRSGRPAHRDGNVLRWLAAYTASMVGDGVYFIALGWTAEQTATPAQVGMVMAAAAVPRAVLMLGGGVVADRFGPRRAVLGSDAARCLVMVTVAATLALTRPGMGLLLTVALVFGALDALFMPAVGALPPRLTGPDQLARVQGMVGFAVRLGNTAGPPLSGLALGLGGTAAAFALAGGLFAVSLALLLTVRIAEAPDRWEPAAAAPARGHAAELDRRPPDRPGGGWRQLLVGLRYIRGHRVLGPLLLSVAVSELAIQAPLNVGVVLLAAEHGWGSAGVGWMVSAFGVGAGASALLLAVAGRVPRAGGVLIAAGFVTAASLGCVGVVSRLSVAVPVVAVAGFSGGLFGGLNRALVQAHTEPSRLGRVSSVLSLSSFGVAPLAYPLFGAGAGVWGTGVVCVCCGVLSAMGVGIALASRSVRTVELPR